MPAIRPTLERAFSKLGEFIFHHPLKFLFLTLLCTSYFVAQVPKLAVDTSNEAYFLKNDPALINYEKFRHDFGRDESMIIAIATDDVFDADFLRRLKQLHQALSMQVPYIDEINSLINARDTRGIDNVLHVGELLQDIPENPQSMLALRQRVLSNPFYLDRLVTADGKATLIAIRPQVYLNNMDSDNVADALSGFEGEKSSSPKSKLISNPHYSEMTLVAREVVKQFTSDDMHIYITGFPAVTDAIDQGIKRTMQTLIPISYGLIVIFLFIMFRRFSGTAYPVLIVALGTLTVMGMFPLLGIQINNVSTIIPTFLTVIGVADAVHILAAFYHQYNKSDGSRQARKQAISYAMGHSALAISMTSLTTAAGLLSFTVADVAPVAEFGLVSAIGVVVMFIYTLILLPALLALIPLPVRKTRQHSDRDLLENVAHACANLALSHPWKIFIVSLLFFVTAATGVMQARLSHHAIKWFDEQTDIRQSTEFVDKHFGGSMVMEVIIDSGKANGLYEPQLLKQLDHAIETALSLRNDGADITNAMSINTILREINQALHDNNPAFYSLPESRQLIAQEILLFENSGSDDLERLVDSSYRTMRLTLNARFRDAVEYQPLIGEMQHQLQQIFPQAKVTITGEMSLLVKMVANTLSTMAKSYSISIIVITLLMILFIGELRLGLLSMIPNLVPLFIVIGIMGGADIPIDFSTVLMGSVAIGLVVDDTIHFMHHFRRYYQETGNVEQAVHNTLHTAGRAIFITSVVLAASFYSFVTAELMNTFYFGVLTGTAIVIALLADFLITPAILVLLFRKKSA